MTTWKQNARLVVKGFWGTSYPPAVSYNLTAEKLWKRTSKTVRTLSNVVRLDAKGGSGPEARYSGEIQGAALIRLKHRRIFANGINTATQWTDVGGGGRLRTLLTGANSFGNGVTTLEHADATGDAPSHYLSNNLDIAGSRPFCVNGYIYRPDDVNGQYVWQLRSGRFIFQIRDGRAEAMWAADTYTQAMEDEYWDLLAIEEPSEGQQASIEEKRVLLYETEASLDLGGDEYFVNNAFSLDFMPECIAGRVGVESGNGKRATLSIERPETERGTRMELWNEGRLHVRSSGGGYFWQAGTPWFYDSGEAVLKVKSPAVVADLGGLSWTLNRDLPTGTDATLEQRSGSGSYDVPLAIVLTSSNNRYSPCVYGAAAHFEGGERNGLLETVWDSDDHKIDGMSPILDLVPSWDENGRTTWEIGLPLLGGTLLSDLPGFNYPYMEGRVVSLTIGGVPVLTNGIVTAARISNLAQMTPDLPETLVERAGAELHLTVNDGWAICEEALLLSPPVGDALRAGIYGKRILRACGFSEYEVSTISDTAGAVIVGADAGEDWAQLPSPYASAASILRGIEEKFGLGRQFRQGADGRWYFARKSNSVTATFTSSGAGHDPLTDSGILQILRPLDWERGCDDQYNVFVVTGAERRDGSQVTAVFRDYASRFPSNSPAVLNYLGRWRLCTPLHDPALRTQGACDVALRSLRELYGGTGRKAQFETYFNLLLKPGALLDIDGRMCRVCRASGSWAKNEMQVYVREVA